MNHDFYPIENIVVKNSTNFSGATKMVMLLRTMVNFAIAVFTPFFPFAILVPGVWCSISFSYRSLPRNQYRHPTLPEYVFYHARHKRTEAFCNTPTLYIQFLVKLGAYVGFQVRADVTTRFDQWHRLWLISSRQGQVAPSPRRLMSVATN